MYATHRRLGNLKFTLKRQRKCANRPTHMSNVYGKPCAKSEKSNNLQVAPVRQEAQRRSRLSPGVQRAGAVNLTDSQTR